MKNDAIIFDIDGTLWNACHASAKGWNLGLESLNIKPRVTAKQIESVAGNPFEQCIEILLPGIQTRYPNLQEILTIYETEVIKSEGGKFYDGVIEGVKAATKGYKVFLVSNCPDWYIEIFLNLSQLNKFLSGYDCHGMSGVPKKDMLERLKTRFALQNPVYIGDTAGDEEAAQLAGIDFIHVSYGFGRVKDGTISFGDFFSLMGYFSININ